MFAEPKTVQKKYSGTSVKIRVILVIFYEIEGAIYIPDFPRLRNVETLKIVAYSVQIRQWVSERAFRPLNIFKLIISRDCSRVNRSLRVSEF